MRRLRFIWKKMPIRAKIGLGYVPALVMVFAVISGGYWAHRSTLLRDSKRIVNLVVNHHSQGIQYFLKTQQRQFNQWMQDDIYGLAIEFDSLAEVEREFQEMLATSPHFNLLALTDTEGRILALGGDSQWQSYENALRGQVMQDALVLCEDSEDHAYMSNEDTWEYLGISDRQVCFFAQVCRDSQGRVNGTLLGYCRWEPIQEELLNAQEYLVGNGYGDATLTLMREETLTVLGDSHLNERPLMSVFETPYSAWLQETVETEETRHFRLKGDDRYCSVYRIDFPLIDREGQNAGMQMLAVLSEQDIFGVVQRQLRMSILVVVLIVPMLWALLWAIAGRIVTPLMRLSQVAQRVGHGDLTSMIEVGSGGEMGSLEHSFASMKRDLTDILGDVKQAVQEIIAAGIHIQCASEQQALETKEQASAVSQTAAAAVELSTTSKRIGENVDHVTGMADRVLLGMDHIRSTTRETSELLSLLDNKSKQIVGIVGLINTVADKTNMLAVNASIEAARAGEQGRGFAVVADQITRLAKSTSTSTKGIAELIEEIQNKMLDAIGTMERSVESVEEGMELARTSVSNSQEIAMSANQQVVCSKQISEAMRHIDEAMSRINRDAQNSAEIATELTQVADRLQNVVARFRVVESTVESVDR